MEYDERVLAIKQDVFEVYRGFARELNRRPALDIWLFFEKTVELNGKLPKLPALPICARCHIHFPLKRTCEMSAIREANRQRNLSDGLF